MSSASIQPARSSDSPQWSCHIHGGVSTRSPHSRKTWNRPSMMNRPPGRLPMRGRDLPAVEPLHRGPQRRRGVRRPILTGSGGDAVEVVPAPQPRLRAGLRAGPMISVSSSQRGTRCRWPMSRRKSSIELGRCSCFGSFVGRISRRGRRRRRLRGGTALVRACVLCTARGSANATNCIRPRASPPAVRVGRAAAD